MKTILIILILLASSFSTQLAFPGAEGYGRYAAGGRGGKVIYVTNLNNSGAGSLRAACQDSTGARTVVFAVGGRIHLSSFINITSDSITIAGQTAPGDGITLTGAGIYIATDDVIIRHIRVRPGDSATGEGYDNRDAISIGQNAFNIIIDHVSMSWATDENFQLWYAPHDVTVQWSIISEALDTAGHSEGSHSMGLLIGNHSKDISIHHNLLAHNQERNPYAKDSTTSDIINNVFYNWGSRGLDINADTIDNVAKMNVVGNYFKAGPNKADFYIRKLWPDTVDHKIYNARNGGDDSTLILFNQNPSTFYADSGWNFFQSTPVFSFSNIGAEDAQVAYQNVLAHAGATKPKRDTIDSRVINDVIKRTGGIINSQNDVGGYPVINAISVTPAKFDSDLDGMPDSWEIKQGLSPSTKDGNDDADGDGYTNLEEYLNSI